jgi:transcription-repair coupling factor (superfamily II helicase)
VSYAPLDLEPLAWKVEGSIDRFFRNQEEMLDIVGTSSPSVLAALLSLHKIRWSSRPHLIVVATLEDANALACAFSFFEPDVHLNVLPPFDVGVYSGLYPNRRVISQRVGWLWRARHAKAGEIFVAPIDALVQKTIPYGILHQAAFTLSKNSTVPDNLSSRLQAIGYMSVPIVEDVGTFALRGGILDIFSPAHPLPIRFEMFGDVIDSMREFDPDTQRSGEEQTTLAVIPAQEILFSDERRAQAAQKFKQSLGARDVDREEAQLYLQSLSQGQYQQGMDFLVSYFYENPDLPTAHFLEPLTVWKLDPLSISREYDELVRSHQMDFESSSHQLVRPSYEEVFASIEAAEDLPGSVQIRLTKVRVEDTTEAEHPILPFSCSELTEISATAKNLGGKASELATFLEKKLKDWKNVHTQVFFSTNTQSQAQRLKLILEKAGVEPVIVPEEDFRWNSWAEEQERQRNLVHIIPRDLPESFRAADESFLVLRDADLFGAHARSRKRERKSDESEIEARAHALNFGDLKPGDFIVHKMHGIGVYEGLKVMPISGYDAEFLQLKYKGNDRLYLPVYRIGQIQKYSGPSAPHLIDKLGGPGWEKTKTKVKAHLRDVAADLLDIYTKRALAQRPPYHRPDEDYFSFEASFPYQETEDQLRAIEDILSDLRKDTPMDRLVCGDVGFGKTEVAMRAAFKVVQEGKQVAIVAPTTILTFQHLETFRKRFAKWPFEIRSINRFVPKREITRTLNDLKEGKVDILIGTHRLFSQDVHFKDLGLLVIDEEQRFGVKHKEKLRKLRAHLDSLAMSATPIPRTLNLSLVGVRDLSLINTPPVDRLPTRTFVTKFDKETIRKSILSEISRGGQIYFIHNRIQSIYALAEQLRETVPEVKFKVAHGQMAEGELEKVMVEFFHHEIDMLLCTTIVESGMDISKANTMFIDNAHQFGLSQLYQLRGRVGRSKERAYCYLMVPNHQKLDKEAQDRLRILQENSSLGSGIRIAQYDLELRGAGDILGEEQAGHINAVGYELYLELLDEAVHVAKGETPKSLDLEPEINVRIPALIPDKYISDIRVRLAYYKALSEIQGPEDLDRIEDELRDQFGKPPEAVLNLMGLMLIRKVCRDLAVRDLSSGKASVTLAFTEGTTLSAAKVVELASRANKKYSITPDNRLSVRMHEITWPRILEELEYLKSL